VSRGDPPFGCVDKSRLETISIAPAIVSVDVTSEHTVRQISVEQSIAYERAGEPREIVDGRVTATHRARDDELGPGRWIFPGGNTSPQRPPGRPPKRLSVCSHGLAAASRRSCSACSPTSMAGRSRRLIRQQLDDPASVLMSEGRKERQREWDDLATWLDKLNAFCSRRRTSGAAAQVDC